jgi:hypothetical protein
MATAKTTIMSHRYELPLPALQSACADHNVTDEHSQVDVADCNGFLMDRIADSIVLIRCVNNSCDIWSTP